MAVRVGVDVGGTFTDAVMVNEDSGEITRACQLLAALATDAPARRP